MELTPGDLLSGPRDHRLALEGTGAAFPSKVDGGARERTADPSAPEARAGDEAGAAQTLHPGRHIGHAENVLHGVDLLAAKG
jgi:hypothetical protein